MAGYVYFAVYKPYGYLSQFTPDIPGQLTLKDLHPFPKDVYPVGRLDKTSEGLLLLTNDRQLHQKIQEPRSEKWKTYLVQVEGKPDNVKLNPLRAGIALRIRQRNFITKPAKVRMIDQPVVEPRQPPIRIRKHIPDTWLEIAITEGKYHQIRKMCAAIGFPVLRLIRIQIGHYRIPDMCIGKVHIIQDQSEIY